MRFDQTDQSFQQLTRLECPDCGGKLLRGPRALAHNHNVTCRQCRMRFNLFVVDRHQTGFYESITSDNEFMSRVSVLGWEYTGKDDAGAAYYDPSYPPRHCDFCNVEYTGPAVYCCLACALADA